MARLSAVEQKYFQQLFIKNGVEIYGFQRINQFDDFCEPIIGFRPSRKYGKYIVSECFEEFLRIEDPVICIPVLDELLEMNVVSDRFFSILREDLINKCREIIKRYSGNDKSYKLPSIDRKGLEILEKDINRTLVDNDYILAVDRLHTYSLFFFEDLCKKNGLTPNKDPKGHIMFDDMISQLQKKFEEHDILNEFDNESIKNSKIIFQKYNVIRNNGSFAHPNQIIENARAKYLINNIIILLNYFLTLNEQILAK